MYWYTPPEYKGVYIMSSHNGLKSQEFFEKGLETMQHMAVCFKCDATHENALDKRAVYVATLSATVVDQAAAQSFSGGTETQSNKPVG